MWRRQSGRAPVFAALVLSALLAGCTQATARNLPGTGDPGRGRALIAQSACGSCHVIPGIAGADGRVGPSLAHWSSRQLIAGRLANTPQQLVAYVRNAQALLPRNVMPPMPLSQAQARDVAAFLYTLP